MTTRLRAGALVPLRPAAPTLDDLSDPAVVAACATGDRAAQAALFTRHVDSVHRFVARMTTADDDAVDDLVQGTFLTAFRCAGAFRGGAQVRTWLFGIAANIVRTYARGEVRRKAMLRSVEGLPRAPIDLESKVARSELLARIPGAVAALPHDLRTALILVDFEETRGAEAAAALGVPEGTLWRRLHQARAALRAALAGGDP